MGMFFAGAAGHSSGAPAQPVLPCTDTPTCLFLTSFDVLIPKLLLIL